MDSAVVADGSRGQPEDVGCGGVAGDRVELKLSFDGPPPPPRGYTTEQPARIALDLPGVTNQLSSKRRDLGGGNARSATVVEAGDRTRLIIGLTQLAPYDTRIEGNYLFVVVGKGVAPKTAAPKNSTTQPPARRLPALRLRGPVRRWARRSEEWISSAGPRAKAMS